MRQMTIENAAKCIRSTVSMLARSQGSYGRLYADAEETDLWQEIAADALAAGVNPADPVALVLYFEA